MEPGWWSPAQPEDMRWALHEMWLEQLAMPRMQLAKRLASHMSLRTNCGCRRVPRSRLRGSLSPVMRSTPVGSSAHGNAPQLPEENLRASHRRSKATKQDLLVIVRVLTQ